MTRTRVALLLPVLLLSARTATPGLGPVDSRLALVLDMRAPGWTVRAKLRLLPTLVPFSVWGVTGTVHCDGDACPGRRARIQGTTRAAGQEFTIQAAFRRGVVCTFTGTTSDPTAANGYRCVDALGNVTLEDTFHVGGCFCGDRRAGTAAAFCATKPCPF